MSIPAAVFKAECLRLMDEVARTGQPVVITKHGRPVAQLVPVPATPGSLFGYMRNTVTIKGDVDGARQRLSTQSWVTGIQEISRNGSAAWNVSVTDPATAEAQLLRLLLADEHMTVTEFLRKQHGLEDIFMQVIAGAEHREGGHDVGE